MLLLIGGSSKDQVVALAARPHRFPIFHTS
jgi:hypothetical protein